MDSLKEIIESILFVAGQSVEFIDIADKLNIDLKEVVNAVKELKKDKEESFSGIQLQIFNNKAQLCTNPSYKDQVAEVLNPIKEKALTKAVLEVAAIIAYKQPITRLDVEEVRGVNSDYAVNVLIENKLIEVVGRKDAIGKPLLYGTTDEFLKRFNMQSINDLPDYDELIDRIKVIRTPENSLFDYSNLPDITKPVHDDEETDLINETELSESDKASNNLQEVEILTESSLEINKQEKVANEELEELEDLGTMQTTMQQSNFGLNKDDQSSDDMINAFINALSEEELLEEII